MKIRNLYRVQPHVILNGTATVWRLFQGDDFLSNVQLVSQLMLDAGVTIEPHEHDDKEEVYFILGGIGEIQLGDETQEVKEGDAIYIPPRTIHTMRNTGTQSLRFISVGAAIA